MSAAVASAPAKAILLGEHGVNRGQPALAVAVGRRALCRVAPRADGDDGFALVAEERCAAVDRRELLSWAAELDALIEAEALDALREHTRGDFFAPARYVLAALLAEAALPGLDVEWRSDLPIGSGLGSGAAVSAAMVVAALGAVGREAAPEAVARLVWKGDVVAHGGTASALDASACAWGGLVRYAVASGAHPVHVAAPLPLVVGDTLVRAHTGEVNARVRAGLARFPARAHLFREMGLLVRRAEAALAAGDLETLGGLMNLNQRLLEKLGVSSPEIERLVEAALGVGALGAKLSGSGGGGIVLALSPPGGKDAVAAAMDAAGGRAMRVAGDAPGARRELDGAWSAEAAVGAHT